MSLLHKEITEKIIRAYYNVYNYFGSGYLEKVYENALVVELGLLGLEAVAQQAIVVRYKGKIVGDYFADVIVNNQIIIELKVAERINSYHQAQLLNYLKATNKELGFVMTFGSKPSFKRLVLEEKNN